MATFEVKVCKIEVEPHNNADALELAKVGEFRAVVKKGQFCTGDLALYIPEAAVVPENVLNAVGLVGKLAGSQHNRVKAVKLRGAVSQGICVDMPTLMSILYPVDIKREDHLFPEEGAEFGDRLNIIKYEPPIPAHLAGEVENRGTGLFVKYDVENWKKYPTILREGEQVVVTEKIHGTFLQVVVQQDGSWYCGSKGRSWQGLAFKDNERNATNLYLRTAKQFKVAERTIEYAFTDAHLIAMVVCGEVYGKGVQDLDYGVNVRVNETLGFRVFDVLAHHRNGSKQWLSSAELDHFCKNTGLERVPVLYRGAHSVAGLKALADGKTTLDAKHIREGVVVQTEPVRFDDEIGRVKLKLVSDAYLFRGGEQTDFT